MSLKTEFTLTLFDDESTRLKLESMDAMEVMFDDERNNIPQSYFDTIEQLKPGETLTICIQANN